MISLRRNLAALLLSTTCLVTDAFAGVNARTISTSLLASTTATNTDDLLKPAYDIEPITIRIGHGFDIHRMAPIEEAGQPVVIGGVEITHKDQKVREFLHFDDQICFDRH